MSWLTSDVNLAETDTQQLRRRLGWLLEDLRAHAAQDNEQPDAVTALAAQLDDHFARLRQLETLLDAVRRSVT